MLLNWVIISKITAWRMTAERKILKLILLSRAVLNYLAQPNIFLVSQMTQEPHQRHVKCIGPLKCRSCRAIIEVKSVTVGVKINHC